MIVPGTEDSRSLRNPDLLPSTDYYDTIHSLFYTTAVDKTSHLQMSSESFASVQGMTRLFATNQLSLQTRGTVGFGRDRHYIIVESLIY